MTSLAIPVLHSVLGWKDQPLPCTRSCQ